mgnify:CR=1 FL=1
MNVLSMIMTVVCMTVCVYVYFKVSKVEKSMILIRQKSLQLPSVDDVSKIASRTLKKQFEFARRREIEVQKLRAKREEEEYRSGENADRLVQKADLSGTAETT